MVTCSIVTLSQKIYQHASLSTQQETMTWHQHLNDMNSDGNMIIFTKSRPGVHDNAEVAVPISFFTFFDT